MAQSAAVTAKLPILSGPARRREARRAQLTARKEQAAADDPNSAANRKKVRHLENKSMVFYRKYNQADYNLSQARRGSLARLALASLDRINPFYLPE